MISSSTSSFSSKVMIQAFSNMSIIKRFVPRRTFITTTVTTTATTTVTRRKITSNYWKNSIIGFDNHKNKCFYMSSSESGGNGGDTMEKTEEEKKAIQAARDARK